ncbi:MAG TPA: hypothetical protein VFS43_22795, partial [Polyangiaceae bacterium]|nr:hypothetical protein [Polyangiaceae bacterium]
GGAAQSSCGGLSSPDEVRRQDGQYTYTAGGQTFTKPVTFYAPKAGTQTAPCPMLVLVPGGCSDKASIEWAAPYLASRGYVAAAVTVNAAAAGGASAVQVCADATVAAIGALLSPDNPFAADGDPSRVGAAGYSLGARALTRVQEEDRRVGAVVEFDNLALSEDGDAGSPACENVPGVVRAPRVPAMGQASEMCSPEAQAGGRDAKQTALRHWKGAGQPAMQLVFAGSNHASFGASASAALKPYFLAYAAAWFDRWLKGDEGASERLLADTVDPGLAGVEARTRAQLLSATWTSGAFFDGHDCGDLLAGCP